MVRVFAPRSLVTVLEEVIPVATILVRSPVTGMSEGKVSTTLQPFSMGSPMSKVIMPEDNWPTVRTLSLRCISTDLKSAGPVTVTVMVITFLEESICPSTLSVV